MKLQPTIRELDIVAIDNGGTDREEQNSIASPISARAMATTTSPPRLTTSTAEPPTTFLPYQPLDRVPVTLHRFPSLEPYGLESYSTKHLYLPLRRDILHLAVTYEADNSRSGTANTKTRWEVHGSHRKVRPQKGMGMARIGTKQSPVQAGGGKTFGPKPRDFGTEMNRKVYDLAWRTALSYRYRRGELIIIEDGQDLPLPEDFLSLAHAGRLGRELEDSFVTRYFGHLMTSMKWGKEFGRTTFVTTKPRPSLFTSVAVAREHARAVSLEDAEHALDVKKLLETGRIVMEKQALHQILKRHQSDLASNIVVHGRRYRGPQLGGPMF